MALQTPQRPTIANVDAYTREQSPPSPLPFQRTGTTQGTAPIPPVVNPAGTPAFQAVITKLEQIEREATLRRAALESYAKAVEAFVRNSPEEQKKLAQEIQEGTLAYLNQYLLGTAAAKQPPKISYAGALKTPNTTAVGADPSLRRVALQKRAALPKQGREPEATGTQTVRPSTAGNPTRKSQREKTDLRIYARAEPGTLLVRDQPFLIREAITKAVPQISAKDIPRLWATPTGWAVKPNTKAVYDLILKGSNAALICKATRCTVLERVEKWYTYRLTHTPNVLTGLLDNRLVTADIVSKEAEIQTGVKPVNCHSTGTLGPTSMWYISFKEELGEIRRQQTATRRACELAAKRRQEQRPKDGVQVVIPTPGARVAAYEAAAPQPRRVKRKTAPTGSLNLAELSKRSLAFEEGADVVCVQEPSVYPGTKTQNHPAYECYAPVDSWEQTLLPEREAERPRAMSYTRKAANLITQQRRNGDDRDIVWLEVNGFHIVNVYREPSTRRIIDYITSIQVPPNFLIGGDFNAKHDMFEPGVGSSNQGASLAAWSLSSGADFIGEPGEPTHRAGHTIDLTFSNIPFAETTVRHDLDCGSDHFTLVTLLPGRGQGADGNAGYRVTEANLPRFAHAINSGISHLPQPADVLDTRDLDDIAALLTTLFQNAIKAVGKRPQGTAKSAPWWTPACAELHAGYASAHAGGRCAGARTQTARHALDDTECQT
ncbi:hypothetical protein DID88_009510 [Monilinia fructigena]|uniref:Endonuclease/exonuclease/phosphatase domain-containing protein n=1 Tax=Monilinia fructigena TaxID=38457 RepID=A0A395IMN6_9HELO|nr:hypothetical protein DID88_009510 [Monilinia fructigena]